MAKNTTYRDAGVDIDAGQELVRRIAPAAARTRRPEVLDGLGGFAALCTLPTRYRQPVLVSGTDGVGTKLRLAIDHGRHDGVGQDLVAMCANDVLALGAEPLFFLDYYATAALDVDVAERVVAGIARGCELAGCALAGGETAEMPGFHRPGDYELAGFCVGVVERDGIVDGRGVEAGDVLLGLAASGPHANGYSLIRAVLARQGGAPDAALLDTLLTPTRIYVKPVLAALAATDAVHGMSHITGGGLVDNVPRMIGGGLAADIELGAWPRPAVFDYLQEAGNIDDAEMLRTFNMGLGFVLCVAAAGAGEVADSLRSAGETVYEIGRVTAGDAPVAAWHLRASAAGAKLG